MIAATIPVVPALLAGLLAFAIGIALGFNLGVQTSLPKITTPAKPLTKAEKAELDISRAR